MGHLGSHLPCPGVCSVLTVDAVWPLLASCPVGVGRWVGPGKVGLFPLRDRQVCGSYPARAQQGPGSPVHVGYCVNGIEPQTLSDWEPCLLVAQDRGHLSKATEEGPTVRLLGAVYSPAPLT